jgi:predicted NACHT family NTPase
MWNLWRKTVFLSTAGGAPVAFSREERERHLYIVGKSGSGKTTFLYNLALGDIMQGRWSP